MLRTLIIDDEAHNRDTLRKLLARHCPQVSVVGEASGVAEGLKTIKKLHPDLVFLDMNLIDGSGTDILRSFERIDFRIIFISAGGMDVLRHLKLNTLEFLTKPINPKELVEAVKYSQINDRKDLDVTCLHQNIFPSRRSSTGNTKS